MIKENERILLEAATGGKVGRCPTAAMQSYLMSMRMTLWPAFSIAMAAHMDSLRKHSETAAVGVASMFGVGRAPALKNSAISGVSEAA